MLLLLLLISWIGCTGPKCTLNRFIMLDDNSLTLCHYTCTAHAYILVNIYSVNVLPSSIAEILCKREQFDRMSVDGTGPLLDIVQRWTSDVIRKQRFRLHDTASVCARNLCREFSWFIMPSEWLPNTTCCENDARYRRVM